MMRTGGVAGQAARSARSKCKQRSSIPLRCRIPGCPRQQLIMRTRFTAATSRWAADVQNLASSAPKSTPLRVSSSLLGKWQIPEVQCRKDCLGWSYQKSCST